MVVAEACLELAPLPAQRSVRLQAYSTMLALVLLISTMLVLDFISKQPHVDLRGLELARWLRLVLA